MKRFTKYFYSTLCLTLLFYASFGLAQLTPKQTIKRAMEERKIKPEIIKTTGNKQVEFLECPYTEKDIPKSLKNLYYYEKINARFQDVEIFGDAIDMSVIGPYDPPKSKVVYVPYIPLPADEFSDYLMAKEMSEETRKALLFKHEGKEYVRFFIHPSKTEAYETLIKKYGIVRTEFAGFLGASPRSIYVWHPEFPDMKPFQAKTSLHYLIDGSIRTNGWSKIARSYAVNDALAKIPAEVKKLHNFDFMPEVMQLMPKGKATATMVREIPDELLNPKKTFVPGYVLSSLEPGKKLTLIEKLAGKGNFQKNAAEEMRPLMNVIAYLLFSEGLKGEPHEQNVYFEIDKQMKPTGKVIIKDLDGFRVDPELRLFLGKSNEGLEPIFKPFIYSKMAAASGWGRNDAFGFDQETYHIFMKNTFGYSFCEVYHCTEAQKKLLFEEFDKVMAEEASKVTGLFVNPRTLASNEEGMMKGLEKTAALYRDVLNERIHYDLLPKDWKAKQAQNLMRSAFMQLRNKKRGSSVLQSLTKDGVYFFYSGDMIVARMIDPKTFAETSIGYVSVPSDSKFRKTFESKLAVHVKDIDAMRMSPVCKVKLSNLKKGH